MSVATISMFQPSSAGAHVAKHHGQGVRLLAAGTGRTPDTQSPAHPPCFEHVRQHHLLKHVEGCLVAEEKGFVCCQGVGNLAQQGFVPACSDDAQKFFDVAIFEFVRDRREPAFNEIGFFRGQDDTRAILDQVTGILKIDRTHVMAPPRILCIAGDIALRSRI